MSDLQVRGPLWGGSGSPSPFTATNSGAQRVSDAHGRYMEAVLRGNVYFLSVAAGAATAYVGAAAGTPLIAVHNPANSNKYLVPIMCSIASRVAASAAGTATFAFWSGPSVIPTGTQTSPTNMLSQAATGAAGKGFANAALTGSTALALVLPVASYYWATAASALLGTGVVDLAGLLVVAPGNQLALGATAALTSATYDVSVVWEEIPMLT